MKVTTTFLSSLSVLIHTSALQAQVLDLTQLHSYQEQETPAYITRDNTPADNPITDIGATLGRVLFYDRTLSKNRSISCASCHQQKHAFGDPNPVSTGVAGTTGRHSMRLINARFSDEGKFFWDERATSLETQTTMPIQDHIEMGFSGKDGDPDFSTLVTRIEGLERYRVLFQAVYGDSAVTEERMQSALAQFIRSIQSFDSKYDRGRAAAPNNGANFTNFTAQENLGKQIFTNRPGPGGGAGCASCHRAPEFDIDPNSGHNGVVGSIDGSSDLTNTRAPSLRDLVASDGSSHGGFMHDASLATLMDVVNHYNAIPAVTAGLDRRLTQGPQPQRLNLSTAQKEALVAFLQTLTGSSVYTDQKWASPFDQNGHLSYVVLPSQTKMAIGSNSVTVTGQGVPNVEYLVTTSATLEDWDAGTPVTAAADGSLSLKINDVPDRMFYRFIYVVSPE